MNKDIRLYSQNLPNKGGDVRLVATSEGGFAWSIEIKPASNGGPKKAKIIDPKTIKRINLSVFQEELVTSEWNALPERYAIGTLEEKQFLHLLASLWTGNLLSETGVLPILDDQKLIAESLIGVCRSLSITISNANNAHLTIWLKSGGVWRKAQGCWF